MATRKAAPPKEEAPRTRGARRRPTQITSSKQIPDLERLVPTPITEEDRLKLSLGQKRARVMDEIGILPKRGWNDFHKYWYALEADLDAYMAPLFAKYNIVVDISVEFDKVERIELGRTSGGAMNTLTRLPMSIALINGDKPEETAVFQWIGEGSDTGDKGVYKAYTGGMKFFYMKHFLIATGDDPEGFEMADREAAESVAAGVRLEGVQSAGVERGGYQTEVTEAQIVPLKALSRALELSPIQMLETIDELLDTKLTDQVPPDITDTTELTRVVTKTIRLGLTPDQLGSVIAALTERAGKADKAE